MMQQGHLVDVDATEAAGAQLAASLTDGAVVGIDGPLGAGKTSFTRGLAMAMGVPSHAVTSPSFSIIVEHVLADGRTLRHIDAWRLHGSMAQAVEELSSLGWDEWAGTKGTLTVVEWAQRIDTIFDTGAIRIELDYDGSGRLLSVAADASPSGEIP